MFQLRADLRSSSDPFQLSGGYLTLTRRQVSREGPDLAQDRRSDTELHRLIQAFLGLTSRLRYCRRLSKLRLYPKHIKASQVVWSYRRRLPLRSHTAPQACLNHKLYTLTMQEQSSAKWVNRPRWYAPRAEDGWVQFDSGHCTT